jgi:hypothetical protein
MITRRRLIRDASLVSLAVCAGAFSEAFAHAGESAVAGAVIQAGHPSSEVVAGMARRRRLAAFEVGDDVTPVFLELRRRWSLAPVAVAGLTSGPALMVIEQLARDHGLRLLFEVAHQPVGEGLAQHVGRGPPAALGRFWHGLAAGAPCAACLADLAFGPRLHLEGASEAAAPMVLPSAEGLQAPLHSWIITPRRA